MYLVDLFNARTKSDLMTMLNVRTRIYGLHTQQQYAQYESESVHHRPNEDCGFGPHMTLNSTPDQHVIHCHLLFLRTHENDVQQLMTGFRCFVNNDFDTNYCITRK